MNKIVDSHCHINLFPQQDIKDVVNRALKSGVEIMQTVCTNMEELASLIDLSKLYGSVYTSVGVHPNEANNALSINDIVLPCEKHQKIIGIGETGLDYYKKIIDPEIQKKSFITHIQASRLTGLPVIIHSRDADNDMIEILQEEQSKGEFKALLHSFASSYELYKVAIDLGLYISFSGIVTFDNAKVVQKVASEVSRDRILFETDAPYLAPVPHRGLKNEPSFVVHTIDFVANLRSDPSIHIAAYENFLRLFSRVNVY